MEFGEEEEIELSLGLAIGGRRARADDRASQAPVSFEEEVKEVDFARKREAQAMRRQEARRKREEKKQMKRSGGLGEVRRNSIDDNGGNVAEVDGANEAERVAKREKIDSIPQTLKSDSVDRSSSNTPGPASAYAFPIYAYPSFQYVPFANGFTFPCIAPAYKAESEAGSKTAAAQTVSFRPFMGGATAVNGRKEELSVKAALSNGSVGCCSSAISENRSISSAQDGSTSDSGSYWRGHKTGKGELHSSSGSDAPRSSKRKALSNPSTTTNAEKANIAQPTAEANLIKQNAATVDQKPAKTPISRTTSLPEQKVHMTNDNKEGSNSPGKPPRPQPVQNKETHSSLSQMPCVSATGNGPDGKTVTGFLYRYNTTAEVSIVCICHGESFSPAEFVKHAGGIDITHPLRQITVVPSAF